MKNKNIDYVFVYFNARKKRINEGKESPEEFFYGYQYIKNYYTVSNTLANTYVDNNHKHDSWVNMYEKAAIKAADMEKLIGTTLSLLP